MNEVVFLETLGMMIVMSGVLLVVTRKLSVPSIVLFILAGLLLGPIFGLIDLSSAFGAGHHDEGPNAAIAMMSHLGIALLLFLVGMELSLERIKDVGKVAAMAGAGQVIGTAGLGLAICLLLGFNVLESGILAVALTFSSTVVVVKLLGQKKETHSLHGRIAVGVLLVQDLVVIIALTLLAGLSGGGDMNASQVGKDLGLAFGGMALMLVLAAVLSKFVLPKPFNWAARQPEVILIWSLGLCFGFVSLAESLHLSSEIGAFLAGMSLAQLPGAHDLTRRLQSLMNFFVAVFFVTLGAQMQLTEIGDDLIPALILSVFILLGKPLLLMLIIARLGYKKETCFKTGVVLGQISEFSFILAAMALASGFVGKNVMAVIGIVGLSTISLSSYGIIFLDRFYAMVERTALRRFLKAQNVADTPPLEVRQGHVIVIGMNTLGRQIVQGLGKRHYEVVAIDTDFNKLKGLPATRVVGNVEYLQVLEEYNYERALLVVSALQIEDTNNLIAYRCRQAGVPCAIHGFDATVLDDLKSLDVTYLIDSKRIGMAQLTAEVKRLEAVV